MVDVRETDREYCLWTPIEYPITARLKTARRDLSRAKNALLWAGDTELAIKVEEIQKEFREKYPRNQPR